jgi:small subunit ribosomal protein S9
MADIKQPVTKQKKDYLFAVGRRKAAVARVRLYEVIRDGLVWETNPVVKGEMLVNGKPVSAYFASETMRYEYSEPLRIVNAQNKYAITVRVVGGGPAGQLDATVAGISNALAKIDPEYRRILKQKGFLTRDSRIRERRKVGTGGKARRAKQSPKR